MLRTYACVVLDFSDRLKALRKRHASMRERLTAAAAALHANARDQEDRRLMAPDNTAVGGVSLRVSMIRELHELSSIGTGDDTAAVDLTAATVQSTGSEEGEVGGSSSRMLRLPSAIQAAAAEYSGREDAVAAGLADLSVSTVGDAADGTLSTSGMAFTAASTAAKAAAREAKTDLRSGFPARHQVRFSKLTVAGSHSSLHTNRYRVFGTASGDLGRYRLVNRTSSSGLGRGRRLAITLRIATVILVVSAWHSRRHGWGGT